VPEHVPQGVTIEIAASECGDHVAALRRNLGVGDAPFGQAYFDVVLRLRHDIRRWR
jgi:hypothetical protein